MVGCGNVQHGGGQRSCSIPRATRGTGSIVRTFAGLSGTDELWYDPTTNAFYVTGNNGTNDSRFFDIISDAPMGGTIHQTVDLPTTGSAHSITVDPLQRRCFRAAALARWPSACTRPRFAIWAASRYLPPCRAPSPVQDCLV